MFVKLVHHVRTNITGKKVDWLVVRDLVANKLLQYNAASRYPLQTYACHGSTCFLIFQLSRLGRNNTSLA